LEYQQDFGEIKEGFKDYLIIYTDGSKNGDQTGSACFSSVYSNSVRLPDDTSIFTAEAKAMLLVLRYIEERGHTGKFLICSDSLSCLQALKNKQFKSPIILEIVGLYNSLILNQCEIVFCWIPGHVGILGNTKADQLAKDALQLDVSPSTIPHLDYKQNVNDYVKIAWQVHWDYELLNKLHMIQPKLGLHQYHGVSERRDEIVLNRCRIGHTYLTHGYLLRSEPFPICISCQCPLTVQHILLECIEFADSRQRYYTCDNLHELLSDHCCDVLKFLKEIRLYSKF
jgi:kelch-like protein 2/3